jgi:hypothetical protein
MSLQSDTNNDIFIIPSQSLMQFSGSDANPIVLYVEPSGSVNFVGTTGSILKIMDNLSGSLFSVNNISGLPILEVFSNNQIKMGNPSNYALIVSESNVIITGSLVDKGTGVKFLVVDTTTGVVHTTGSGGGGGSPTTPASPLNSIQYNNAGAFGGVPTLTYDGTILRATGSFTGSFTGSLLGTSSFANSASQAISASYVFISSSNIATLEVSYATPGVIALLAKTGSGIPGGSTNQLQFNAGGNLFGGVNSSSYNSGNGELTLGNIIATGSLFGTSSYAITASYVNIGNGATNLIAFWSGSTFLTGSSLLYWDNNSGGLGIGTSSVASTTRLHLVNDDNNSDLRISSKFNQRIVFTNTTSSRQWFIASDAGPTGPDARDNFGIGITSNPTLSPFQIHRSGSYSGLSTNRVKISASLETTGSLLVTGSTTLTGSFNVHNSLNGGFYPTFENPTNSPTTETGFTVVAGNGISGSFAYIGATPKGYTSNPYYSGSTVFTTAPTNISGDSTRNMRQIFNISGTPAASSFEWHYQSTYNLSAAGLKMKLDVPSGILSNQPY